VLVGRSDEQGVLTAVLSSLRSGRSAAAVVTGEPGIGKTTLLDWLVQTADGVRVIRATGVQQEMEFSFGGLHNILSPLLVDLERLPPPQQQALRQALVLADGPPPDRFLVYLSALTLITTGALREPLLFVVDDIHWLDRQSREALAFAARRVLADPVGFVFSVRPEEATTGLECLPLTELRGLPPESAQELLLSIAPDHQALDHAMASRILSEARGNPLAIQELAADFVGGSLSAAGPLDPLPLSKRLESRFLRLAHGLPHESQFLLLLAACEPTGRPEILLAASKRLGLSAEAADVAEQAGLIRIFPRVEFRHPLVRSAVYGAASPGDRRRAHLALAGTYVEAADDDMKAWHLGSAATGPDEAVAGALEASAARARSRGGYAAEASFLARAADLTSDSAAKGSRLLSAARAAAAAGSQGQARALLAQAQAVIQDGDLAPYGRWLRGLFLVDEAAGYDEGAAELLGAADALKTRDPEQARLIYLDAIAAGLMGSCGRADEVFLPRVSRAALATTPVAGAAPRMADLLLEGVATRLAKGYGEAAPILAQAIRTWQPIVGPAGSMWTLLGHYAALDLWDFEAFCDWNRRVEQHARTTGVLPLLRLALVCQSSSAILAGRLADADAFSAEAEELSAVMGSPRFFNALHYVEVWGARGMAAETTNAAGVLEQVDQDAAFDAGLYLTRLSLIRLSLARCDYGQAAAVGQSMVEHACFGKDALIYADLVEAALRTGKVDLAWRAADVLAGRTKVSGALWGRGLAARCCALLAADQVAEEHYQESASLLAASGARFDELRSVLLYGEWLRRQHRRADARVQLQSAFEAFTEMGALAFAERARCELSATGQRTAPAAQTRERQVLTAQESRIAELAVQGHTKAEMAAMLYISAHTVDYHLRRLYLKFGVRSRRELARAYKAGAASVPGSAATS
jgi:DNA-binding CsgD family transcriptional regulator